ncbi:hypothetical protein HOC80_01865 [archaeon]|jgi:polyhydroxyalkanoate synthesis regulator phasin|nr:hypothetical protein [archaeon]MBT4416828.1 hypothetical protein [archaeon]
MEEIQNNIEEDHQEAEGDLMYEAHAKVDALIDLLVKKGIINEEEYDNAVEKLLTDLEEDDDEEPEEQSGCCSEHSASCESSEQKPAESGCGCASQSPSNSGF